MNLGYFQPVIAHTSQGRVTVTMTAGAVADWQAEDSENRWSVPVNLLVSKLTRFGAIPMSVQVGGGYYVVRPSDGPDLASPHDVHAAVPARARARVGGDKR